jgi:hypothetical protein
LADASCKPLYFLGSVSAQPLRAVLSDAAGGVRQAGASMEFVTVPGVNLTTTAPGVPGNVTKGLGDLDSGFDIGATLTANDKKLVGWVDPNTTPGLAKINTAADMLAFYRHSGQITGEVTRDFVNALQSAIASGNGIPINPALLMSKGASQNPLSPETASALFSILSQNNAASPQGAD